MAFWWWPLSTLCSWLNIYIYTQTGYIHIYIYTYSLETPVWICIFTEDPSLDMYIHWSPQSVYIYIFIYSLETTVWICILTEVPSLYIYSLETPVCICIYSLKAPVRKHNQGIIYCSNVCVSVLRALISFVSSKILLSLKGSQYRPPIITCYNY